MLLSRPRTTFSRLISHQSRELVYSTPFRRLSSSSSSRPDGNGGGGESREMTEVELRKDAYNQLENLDFMKAAKILFTVPPKQKKFGFDFHLVQFFFACLPSVAVYLVAQYARQDMKKMEAEIDVKNKEKTEEEQKVKQAELESIEKASDNKLSKIIERLDAIEEAVKIIKQEKNVSTNSSPSKSADQLPGSKNNVSDRSSAK